MKCVGCGLPIGEMPEDATFDELLCNECYETLENLSTLRSTVEDIALNFKVRNKASEAIEVTEPFLEKIYEDMLHTSDSFKDGSNEFKKLDAENSFMRVIIRSINNNFRF